MATTVINVLNQYSRDRRNLIPILQKVQEKEKYLSSESISEISIYLGISENDVYSVASFYSQFRFIKPGEHTVKVCLGTACHVRGGARVLETVERELKIKPGQTTADGKYSLETVACIGACALAPTMVLDNEVQRSMTPQKVVDLLKSKNKAENDAK
ncbi:MAG: NADH-quinone oxidoreductase subunit NuoE [Dehalococcoidales bacterium]|jgi:NADH-quinone oxidoreductase subunit E|nr:NADH-quinone oxidoreductase subunit NuoE [Dehalococcoidales bacterium]MDD3994418.1 NADH-quinone oxidoreductase subunit NuoE [Dehalococcoidales bacterium]NLT28602.1 NADH-quinone oxidoreductase subunit NuoE [Dehalococcoidales bacterium]